MSEARRKKPDAPPTGSITSSRVDPPSDESFTSSQQQGRQSHSQLELNQEMRRQQQQRIKAADSKNAVYVILQASKNVPRQHGTQVSAEEEAQMNEYCNHVLAQNSSVVEPSFLGSETEESGNLDHLQVLSVNEHFLAGTLFRSMCSSTSMYCGDTAQVDPCCSIATTGFRKLTINSSDERKAIDNGTKVHPPTGMALDEYRDDCYDALEECDFKCAVNSDYAAVMEGDHNMSIMNRDYDAVIEENHHIMEDIGEVQPVQYPHISPLSSDQQDISNRSMSFLHLKPVESIFSSMTTDSAMIQPSPQTKFHTGMEYKGHSGRNLRRRQSDTSESVMHMVAEIPVNDGDHGEETEVVDRVLNVPAVDAQGATQQTKTVIMDDESASSKPCITRVEIHMDECEIDVEWKKGSIQMGGSENGSTSSLESEDRDDDSANDPSGMVRSGTSTNKMTNNEGHPSQEKVKPTSTVLHQLTGSGEPRDEMAGEEERQKSTYLPFFVTPRLFMPSDCGTNDDDQLESDGSRSCSSSLSSNTPKSGSYNSGSVTTRSFQYSTTDASGSKHCSKHVKTSFLTMWSSGSGSPPQSPCHHRPCDTPTPPPLLQGPTEHLLPYQTESSSNEEMYQDITSTPASSRRRANRKVQTRKISVQRGRSRESRSTGSGSNVTDPEGEVIQSISFHCVDTSEPEGDLQISRSYHFGESSPTRSVTRHRPKTQNQWGGDSREPGVESPMHIVESESGEGTFITGGSSTSPCRPKSTSQSEIMNSAQSPYHSSFSAFQSDDMLDDSSESPSQILSDALRNESNDDLSQSSFTGNSSVDFLTDRSYLSPSSPTLRCLAYLDGGNILDPSTSYGNSVATHEKIQRSVVPNAPKNEGSHASVERGYQEENQNGNFLLDELVMGTFSTDKMTDTGGSTTDCTSLAESKKNSLDKFSSSTFNNHEEKSRRKFATESSEEVDKEMRGISFLANQRQSGNGRNDRLPVVDDKNLFNVTPRPRQVPKCPSPLQNHVSRNASRSSEEWADSESSESSLILDDSSSYSSHEDNLVISEPHEELSTSEGISLTAKPPSESVATPALTQPYSIASLQVASLDTKLEKQEYPLVSSLIRKVGSYDAQIIADKTRRQLLRAAQSQERLSSGSASELGSTSLSNRDSNLHGADDVSDTGGSQFQVSPAGRSLLTMFSSSSSSCSSSPSKTESTSADAYHTAAEHVSSPPMVDDSESEISITSIHSKEQTDTYPGMTARQNFGKEQIIGGSQDEQVEVHITANETDLELASSSCSGRQSQRNRSPVAELSIVDKDDEAPDSDASSSSLGRDSQKKQRPDEHHYGDDDDQDRDANNDGGDDDADDQLSLSTTSQDSDEELPPCLALSSVSNEDSQSELFSYDDLTALPLAASQDAPSTDAQNDEAAQEEDTMQSSQQRPWCNHVLTRMKRLMAKCKPRSEPTLLEPLLPRTIQNLDETALWQIRYNLEPPVDTQFHDDLLYIIEEGHLASRSTYMLGQGQARSVCSRIVRKFCELGGFWYFFGLAFLVSALVSCGMVGLGI